MAFAFYYAISVLFNDSFSIYNKYSVGKPIKFFDSIQHSSTKSQSEWNVAINAIQDSKVCLVRCLVR